MNEKCLSGGIAAVERMMQAYGFKVQRELAAYLGAGTGTISTWIKRDYFPGKEIVLCALETGVSLYWLTTGEGEPHEPVKATACEAVKSIAHKNLEDGLLIDVSPILLDLALLPVQILEPELISFPNEKSYFLIERQFKNIADGRWLVEKAGVTSISNITRLPCDIWLINDVNWPVSEVNILAKVVGEITGY
ncbi:TPA: phage repressor protein CI [Yersinia enterocolitica]|uniref:CI repressor of phage 186 and others n=1 Tax=Yersinia enterocolitica TaxID=630 RepID=A0A0H5HUT9_YEREN|nr:phage repressor protein CI [Yersinia enterocolitica]EKN5049077.1 Cro/Cl family transcriptional regulator [Yersinia enterocolitica]EKN6033745.1 Cro/Cl family transcriptional regulator [Yersinia enterocolitica]EKN6071985.1 Cro/Cl family transcriptional regulator [Yersinia enterocolitica]EKN6187648.1 Cro/Cl family transcriptional regulator [Yersinia enterocolitica]EKN6191704.1 Cro/Cl family transcriptional regulator [Yersinia enterocolitica]